MAHTQNHHDDRANPPAKNARDPFSAYNCRATELMLRVGVEEEVAGVEEVVDEEEVVAPAAALVAFVAAVE